MKQTYYPLPDALKRLSQRNELWKIRRNAAELKLHYMLIKGVKSSKWLYITTGSYIQTTIMLYYIEQNLFNSERV